MGITTVVEVVLLSAGPSLRYRMLTAELTGHPDHVARDLAGIDAEPAGLLHSTSWRFQRDRVVLTYAALPDPAPDPASTDEVPLDGGVASEDPLRPAHLHIHAGDVAAHACRHLAFLSHTDPLVGERAGAAVELWRLITVFKPTVAGLLTQPEVAPVL